MSWAQLSDPTDLNSKVEDIFTRIVNVTTRMRKIEEVKRMRNGSIDEPSEARKHEVAFVNLDGITPKTADNLCKLSQHSTLTLALGDTTSLGVPNKMATG